MFEHTAIKPQVENISIIDLGSNSLRMSVVQIQRGGAYSLLHQVKHMVQLGHGAFLHNKLQRDAMDRTLEVLLSFSHICDSRHVTTYVAVATAAVRDAQNGQEFLDQIFQKTGIQFACISGLEEARLIYKGVSEEFEKSHKQRFFLDIGGGSTEFSVGDSYNYQELDSVKMGCVRLANMFSAGKNGKISNSQYQNMQNYTRSMASHTFHRISSFSPEEMVASSGSALNLALMSSFYGNNQEKYGDTTATLTYKGLCSVVEKLRNCTEDERKKIHGINPRRTAIIIPGAAILQTIMEELGFESLTLSTRGLRDGILRDYLEKKYGMLDAESLDTQESSVLKLAHSCNFEEAHSRYVQKFALELFDKAKKCGLHLYDDKTRKLLSHASILHDIGIFISFSNHDGHGQYLIRHSALLGFTQLEISCLASLVHMHRMKKNVRINSEINEEQKIVLEEIGIFLKFAEALDASHGEFVTHIEFNPMPAKDENSIELVVYHKQACPLEKEKMEIGKKLFKKIFGRNLHIRWEAQ